ncbi:prepilin-type N-terminal cleavage/methylation domain-containing protein [Coraliomargarita sp. SDUM461004]|uniref:Prepilin-type N-terminal cleavage/methylation domain-containing protein n=1 Tax=Thalassobacterium sedimentorum TaxID=3041258 RepID=A0ABU1AJ93_9BACT|nr:prepilin-type N-terminal cleavage/methylation domain-containing protein [Coraliomargarita sp. SDUM461004]MDQ8194704.1 prepilin-type N-terminal cleavage/methylation domain-containing protein [Coraliomargarita sp. SDUM461004]
MRSKSAFTLIELLVVISIILIASSIIFIGGNGGAGAKLSSAQRIIAGVAQGARGQAILKNAKTCLIINNDPTDLEKYRRFIGIIYRGYDTDSSGNEVGTEGWIAATQGVYLPEGIYFDPSLSKDYGGETESVNFPRRTVAGSSDDPVPYYKYTFKSNGNSENANEWLVIRAGQLNADGELQAYNSESEEAGLKAALIFRKVGTTTLVDDPTKI